MAAALPLDPDETYYWEWARRPACGYYDHPPGIAVLIRAAVSLFGPTALGLRFFPVAAGALASLSLVGLARRLGDSRAACRAAVVLGCLPACGVLLGSATPDAFLAPYAVALVALDGALAAPPRSRYALGWFAIAGLALGCALCCKYTAVLLPLRVFLALVTDPALRPRLTEAGPYLACALAAVVFLPVVVWNYQHDWISVCHQLRHGFGGRAGLPGWRELSLLGGQLALASPLLFVLAAVAVREALCRPCDGRRFVLAMLTVTPLGFFAVSALWRPVPANWPICAYLPAAVLLAVKPAGRLWHRCLSAGCFISGALLLAFYAWVAMPSVAPFARSIPPGLGYAWPLVAERVAAAGEGACWGRGRAWVAANRYQDAAALAFYLPDHPTVFSLNVNGRRNQYDLWPGFADAARPGDGMVLVVNEYLESDPVLSGLRPYFERVQPGEVIELRCGEKVLKRRLWLCQGWRPPPPGAASAFCRTFP
jgi:4-amino-4-deoxy-L-arabinose transferase-like glycosyltransferase